MNAIARRGGLALVLAIGLLIGGSIASQHPSAHAHAQLVTSVPGAGVVIETAPEEVRLVFSEPLEDSFTGIELMDAEGQAIDVDVRVDEADRRVLVASLPNLADGAYTVNWTALSAADGHVTAGFIAFAVGDAMVGMPGGSGMGDMAGMEESGSVHAGHTGVDAAIETIGRGVGDGGFMLAFGLFVISIIVVAPTIPRARGLLLAQFLALVAGGAGTLVLLVFAGSAAGLDPIGYATGSRSGAYLGGRLVATAALGAVAVLLWVTGHPRGAAGVVALGGFVGILAVAVGGHASALPGVGPVAAMIVHIGAAAIWAAGLVTLVVLGLSGQLTAGSLPASVSRFSALALVTIGLITATGVYSAWVQTRDLTPLITTYASVLDAKVIVVGLALLLGLANLLDGGRDTGRPFSFAGRVRIEAMLVVLVVGLSATLASGSPPSSSAAVSIDEAASSARSVQGSLALQPGRPGPNRMLVQLGGAVPEGGTAEVLLLRQDRAGQTSTLDLREDGDTATYVADGVVLEPDSRWDAAVVLRDAQAIEVGRARFTWALDSNGISEGQSTPILDPALLVAGLLLAAGALGAGFALAGGRLPLVDPAVAKRALLGGGTLGVGLAVAMLLGGPS